MTTGLEESVSNSQRVIITGATGVLGRSIALLALKYGLSVNAVTSDPERFNKIFGDYRQSAEVSSINRLDFLSNEFRLDSHDIIINCGFPRAAQPAQLADGLRFVKDLIHKANEEKPKAIIHISSQSVYDSQRDYPALESSPISLDDNYSTAKYACELLLEQLDMTVTCSVVRLGSLISSGIPERFVNKMVQQVCRGESLEVLSGHQQYSFLSPADAANGILLMAQSNPVAWKRIYNLGSGECISLVEIANTIAEVGKLFGFYPSIDVKTSQHVFSNVIDSTLFTTSYDWRQQWNMRGLVEKLFLTYADSSSEHKV